jgi:hypothetical protein
VFDLDEFFYWSMGDPIPCTVILNRKYHDPEKQTRLAEEQTGKRREELGLEPGEGAALEDQAVESALFD